MFKMFKKITALAMAAVTAGALGLNAFAGGPRPQEDEPAAASTESDTAAAASLPSELSVGTVYSLVSMVTVDTDLLTLNVWAGKDTDGANVDMWKWDGSKEQRFRLISSGSYYKLEAVCSSSGKVLDAYRISGQLKSGCNADIWANDDDEAQQLVITKDPVSNGYVITLAAHPNLALTAASQSNDGAARFDTFSSGALNQKWMFIKSDASLQRIPNPNFQNKTKWCWASAAKIVANHNGGGLDSQLDQSPQMLTDTNGIHKAFYGQGTVGGTTRYFADGIQYAIVKHIKNSEANETGSTNEVKQALKFAANKGVVTVYNNENDLTTAEIINNTNDELTKGRYVIGFVNGTGRGHFIVLEKYNAATDTYTVFNPWDNDVSTYEKGDLLFGTANKYQYLDSSYGRIMGYLSCKPA